MLSEDSSSLFIDFNIPHDALWKVVHTKFLNPYIPSSFAVAGEKLDILIKLKIQ